MSDLTLFKDKNFTKPFVIQNLGDVEAGTSRVIEGYLYNSTVFDMLDIDYEVPDPDVHLKNVPEKLVGESWSTVEIHYNPKKSRILPLNTFVTFTGKKRIPPE